MDFVVIGLGLSALALLTGLTLLCMVAPRWSRKSRAVQPADAVYARALAGERHALGQGFLCVGAVLLLATLGGISAGLADKAGAYVVAAMTTVAALGLFGWDVLYRRQHPVPHRRRVAPAGVKPATAEASAPLSGATSDGMPAATATTTRRRVLRARRREAPASQPANAPSAASAAAIDIVMIEPDSDGDLLPAADLESVVEPAAPQAAGSDTEPGPENQERAAAPGPPEASPSVQTEEPEALGSEDSIAEDPPVIAAELPEPLPFAPAQPNGVADLAASSAAESDAEVIPHGDDRVIALFPTAAARRSRLIVMPTDPDGTS